MTWFWGSSNKSEDATSKLDPSLRDFLAKETPKTQATNSTQRFPNDTRQEGPSKYRSQLGLDVPGAQPNSPDSYNPPADVERKVPAESLFQDGRYAHLWKSYRSQGDVAAASFSDQDRMAAVLEDFSDRKAAIGRAAMENCVMEQLAQRECFTSGSWSRLATMCNAEGKAFNRCYEMQSRFLRALGYLSSPRSEEEEERIQMHADKLYQEMLKREQVMEEARKEGHQAPEMPPLIRPEETVKALGDDSAWARMRRQAMDQNTQNPLNSLTPAQQQTIMDSLKDMNEDEKALELQLLAAEIRVRKHLTDQVQNAAEDEKRQRAERREHGKETIGDTMKRLWGYDR